jgi:hypothetical protein
MPTFLKIKKTWRQYASSTRPMPNTIDSYCRYTGRQRFLKNDSKQPRQSLVSLSLRDYKDAGSTSLEYWYAEYEIGHLLRNNRNFVRFCHDSNFGELQLKGIAMTHITMPKICRVHKKLSSHKE